MLYLASDHAGFTLKESLKEFLKEKGIEFEDLGTNSDESVDYPDYAHTLAEKVLANPENRGVGICGNGIGISIALNRHQGIRASRCVTVHDAEMTRKHNNANILVLGGRITEPELAQEMLDKFLETKFEEGRHISRVDKIEIN